MRRRHEESPIWIGYADFLTTLTVLFFIMAVSFAGKLSHSKSAFVQGVVLGNGRGVGGCLMTLGERRQSRSGQNGQFDFRLDSLRERVNIGLHAECRGFAENYAIIGLNPGDTLRDTIRLAEAKLVSVDTVPGDALFGSSEATLKPEAVLMLQQLGHRLKSQLASDELIAVQGHTDDLPFQAGAEKDNWVLSGERAAAAARVLTDSTFGVGIPECQVAIMGFGPSRPVERVQAEDDIEERHRKRARNRRIEFRMLHGTDIIGGRCGG